MNDLQKAREYAARPWRNCAKAARDGALVFPEHMTPEKIAEYIDKDTAYADAIERGEHDHNFTIRQRMHYYLTGEDVPLLASDER